MVDLALAAEQAVKKAGGGAKVARPLNLTRQAIYQWKRVPAEHVLTLERLSGVPRYQIRPDIYPAPDADAGASE